MHVINASSVENAYSAGMKLIKERGKLCETRNGPAYKISVPVTTVYTNPQRRVLFNSERDANPFFHFFESMWMLAGRNDVESVKHFVARMASFSDNGSTFNGAYGYRWRKHFGFDQIDWAIESLKKDKSNRRIIISMWDPKADAVGAFPYGDEVRPSVDIPCNDMIKFYADGGYLNMIVFNRSNDIIWGAYGANAVHMSFLHEYVAFASGIGVGTYFQISSDYHAYKDIFDRLYESSQICCCRYDDAPHTITTLASLCSNSNEFDCDLTALFDYDDFKDPSFKYRTMFFSGVVIPILKAHSAYKKGDRTRALDVLSNCLGLDWKDACIDWIIRRGRSKK